MRKFTIFLSLLMFIGLQVVNAQNRTITGKVTSAEDGSAIPGVTVSVKGTTTGTLSDIDGKYSLAVPASAKTLTFSFIGMKIQEVEIGGKTIINVSLESSTTAIEGLLLQLLVLPGRRNHWDILPRR